MLRTAIYFASMSLWTLALSEVVVKVDFFGEAQCPYCRKFVREAWPVVWHDKELMEYVQYDFVAWGNAYFQIEQCSHGDIYDPDERACWYEHCAPTSRSNPTYFQAEYSSDDCFLGKVIYQHSEKEGQVDMFENCVKYHYGIDAAVEFTYCAEGDAMEQTDSALDLLLACQGDTIDANVVQYCKETHGHAIEVLAAQQTPAHPGVPYVLVDGEPLDDPFSIQQAICDRLREKLTTKPAVDSLRLPKVCASTSDSISFGAWIS